jgi:hypothetical protein
MKVSRRKRCKAGQTAKRGIDLLVARKASLEEEVSRGSRDARSLVAIPAELARRSTVRFPPNAFGEPEPW